MAEEKFTNIKIRGFAPFNFQQNFNLNEDNDDSFEKEMEAINSYITSPRSLAGLMANSKLTSDFSKPVNKPLSEFGKTDESIYDCTINEEEEEMDEETDEEEENKKVVRRVLQFHNKSSPGPHPFTLKSCSSYSPLSDDEKENVLKPPLEVSQMLEAEALKNNSIFSREEKDYLESANYNSVIVDSLLLQKLTLLDPDLSRELVRTCMLGFRTKTDEDEVLNQLNSPNKLIENSEITDEIRMVSREIYHLLLSRLSQSPKLIELFYFLLLQLNNRTKFKVSNLKDTLNKQKFETLPVEKKKKKKKSKKCTKKFNSRRTKQDTNKRCGQCGDCGGIKRGITCNGPGDYRKTSVNPQSMLKDGNLHDYNVLQILLPNGGALSGVIKEKTKIILEELFSKVNEEDLHVLSEMYILLKQFGREGIKLLARIISANINTTIEILEKQNMNSPFLSGLSEKNKSS